MPAAAAGRAALLPLLLGVLLALRLQTTAACTPAAAPQLHHLHHDRAPCHLQHSTAQHSTAQHMIEPKHNMARHRNMCQQLVASKT
jgi:hypothetical protein